jgi:hypothetical protein
MAVHHGIVGARPRHHTAPIFTLTLSLYIWILQGLFGINEPCLFFVL